jgi:predicted acylesterase/phospholipase RssA
MTKIPSYRHAARLVLSLVLLLSLTLKCCSLTLSGQSSNGTEEGGKLDRCLGLVLKGGANKGSYEAGAIYTLIRNLPPEDVEYRVISGVSVGALSAAHVASYPVGQERQMADDLLKLWVEMTKENLYKPWTWGIIEGLIKEAGLLDSTPMHKFVRDYMQNRTIHRMVHFNSVDAITG